jgi:hypothetical protein
MLNFDGIFTIYKNRLAILLLIILILISGFLSLKHFQTQKKAKISADIAIGIAYLEEGKKDISLYYFEKAFNNSNNFAKVIAGVGVIKSIEGSAESDVKIINILKIIRSYSSKEFKEFIDSVYFSRLLQLKPEEAESKEFKNFRQNIDKSENQTLKRIYGKN